MLYCIFVLFLEDNAFQSKNVNGRGVGAARYITIKKRELCSCRKFLFKKKKNPIPPLELIHI